MKKNEACPCGSGESYKACCRRFHKGERFPKTAEELMRSRYCAFAKGKRTYLLDTWHPSTRPDNLQTDASTGWRGLDIHAAELGTETDVNGTVTFTASYIKDGVAGSMTEKSEFLRESNRWFYLKGEML